MASDVVAIVELVGNYIKRLFAVYRFGFISFPIELGHFGCFLAYFKVGVPFYVYEPKSLGMTDSFIKKSVIIDRNQIARDLVHLKKSISTHNSVILDKDKIFDGVDIDEIDFIGIAKRFNSHPLDITS